MENNKSILIAGFLAFFGIGILVGVLVGGDKPDELSVLEANKTGKEVVKDEFELPLFQLRGKDYFVRELPVYSQMQIFKERVAYGKKLNATIKALVAQIETERRALKKDQINVSALPDLFTYYGKFLNPADVNKIYEREKPKFGDKFTPDQAKSQIRARMLFEKIFAHTKNVSTELTKKKEYLFLKENPMIPAGWRNFPRSPLKGGKGKVAIQFDIFLNYACQRCSSLTKETKELLKKYDESKIRLIFHHFSRKLFTVPFETNVAAQCVYTVDKKRFWKFHDNMLKKSKELSLLKEVDVKSGRKIINKAISRSKIRGKKKKEFKECFERGRTGQEKTAEFNYLRLLTKGLIYVGNHPFPIIALNGKFTDPSMSLTEAVQHKLTLAEK